MADQNLALPVRSEADGTDARVQVKIVDFTTPTQGATVDTDRNVHVEVHGNDPAAVDRVVRTSETGALTPDGVYNAATNTKPGNLGMVGSSRSATPGDTTQTLRQTGIQNGTVIAMDVALFDELGAPYTTSNPLPVTSVDSEGTEINDYLDSATTAIGASVNHDYTVTSAKTLKLSQIYASASGKLKVEVAVETGIASGTFTSKFVGFNSVANPNIIIPVNENIAVAAGVRVRVILTNRDLQIQDLYSTICGHEIP